MDFPTNTEQEGPIPSREGVLVKTAGDRLLIIGTSHFSKEFEEMVDAVIREEKPDLVLVELDPERLEVMDLIAQQGLPNTGSQISPNDEFISRLEGFQLALGTQLGVMPGAEMYQAVQTARELGIAYECIDMPIGDIIQSLDFAPDAEQDAFTAEMQNFDADIDMVEIKEAIADPARFAALLTDFKEQFPSLASTILTARENYMVEEIEKWIYKSDHRKILVVCGLGHKDALLRALGKD
jgi:pheromone shutdown protein TraB